MGDLGGGKPDAAGPEGVSQRIALPFGKRNPQRLKETGKQVFRQAHPAFLFQDDAGQIGAGIAVEKRVSGLFLKRAGEGEANVIVLLHRPALIPHQIRLFLAQCHGQKVAQSQPFEIWPDLRWKVIREQIRDEIIQMEESFLQSKPDGGAGDAFAQRKLVLPDLRDKVVPRQFLSVLPYDHVIHPKLRDGAAEEIKAVLCQHVCLILLTACPRYRPWGLPWKRPGQCKGQ